MPTAEEAKRLGLAGQREPLLVERRIIRDQDDVPIEHTESAYIASRYVIDVTFRMSDAPRKEKVKRAAVQPRTGPVG
jgi:hypothetical protein